MTSNGKSELEVTAAEMARRDYSIEVVREQAEGYEAWFAVVPDLPGCMTQADTLGALGPMVEDAKLAWITTALEDDLVIPAPRQESEISGKFLVRAPKSLHRQVADAAARDGVSLNAWVNVVLARAVGAPQRVAPDVPEAPAPQRKRARLQAVAAKASVPDAVAAD